MVGQKVILFTYYSKIMELIKNYLNYIQNICIIKKILILYSHKPRKRRNSPMISDVCAKSQWRRKVIGKRLEVIYVL